MNVRASVLIPAHNKPTTLPLTVDTVLKQSVRDVEVLVIGDGVTDAVREVVLELTRADERVRFLDFPKGPHHGERYRHDAVMAARSDAIFYLCDDDLLLPDHVADLLELLEDHDLVQSLNGCITPAGEVRLYADDLSDPRSRELYASDEVRFNALSITGTAHSRRFYEKVADPWDTTPEGQWPDHHQFRKLLRDPSCRAATSRRMTALQFPTSAGGRHTWTAEERVAELVPWYHLVTGPDGQATIDRLCAEGALRQLIEDRRRIADLKSRLATTRARLRKQRLRTKRLRRRLERERRAGAAPAPQRRFSWSRFSRRAG